MFHTIDIILTLLAIFGGIILFISVAELVTAILKYIAGIR